MYEFVEPFVKEAESLAASEDLNSVLLKLREMPFDDFGKLIIGLPDPAWPNLSRMLPAMASAQVQKSWTGTSGIPLLKQTNEFTRVLVHNYAALSGDNLQDKAVLDYGCGYGRIIRALYYYCNPDNLYGCDPWDKSLSICEQDGLIANLALSDYLPQHLPFGDRKFDLAYAFSVFTHLSERSMSTSIKALSNGLVSGGILAITIRPIEYWNFDKSIPEERVSKLQESHRAKGFAFYPHAGREAIDGDITYGDTSCTIDYVRKLASAVDLEVISVDRTMSDSYQLYVFLRKKSRARWYWPIKS